MYIIQSKKAVIILVLDGFVLHLCFNSALLACTDSVV